MANPPILRSPSSSFHGLPHRHPSQSALLSADVGPSGQVEDEVQEVVVTSVVRYGPQGFEEEAPLEALAAMALFVAPRLVIHGIILRIFLMAGPLLATNVREASGRLTEPGIPVEMWPHSGLDALFLDVAKGPLPALIGGPRIGVHEAPVPFDPFPVVAVVLLHKEIESLQQPRPNTSKRVGCDHRSDNEIKN